MSLCRSTSTIISIDQRLDFKAACNQVGVEIPSKFVVHIHTHMVWSFLVSPSVLFTEGNLSLANISRRNLCQFFTRLEECLVMVHRNPIKPCLVITKTIFNMGMSILSRVFCDMHILIVSTS